MARARGHQDDRRRRARVRALSVQGQPTSSCDYYGTSLHKWLLAPIGTGFLYVRRENDRVARGRCTPADARSGRTTSASSRRSARTRRRNHNAIAEALDVPRGDRHRAQGRAPALPARPLGEPADGQQPVRSPAHRTTRRSRAPSALCSIDGVRPRQVVATPLGQAPHHRHADRARRSTRALRVTPNVYTTLDEIDTFAEAMEEVCAKSGEL